MKNLRMFQVKYLGATNNRSSRIKITDTRYKVSVTLSKSFEFDNITDQAVKYLNDQGITITCRAWNEMTGDDFLLTSDFTTQIKK